MARQHGTEVNLLWTESFASLSDDVCPNHDQMYVHREILGHYRQTLLGNQVYNSKNREEDLSFRNLSRNLSGFGGATRFHTSAAS